MRPNGVEGARLKCAARAPAVAAPLPTVWRRLAVGGWLTSVDNFHYFPSFPYEVNASEVFVREKN